MGRNTMIDVQSGNVLFKNMVIVRHSKTSFIKGGLFENVTFIFKNDNPAPKSDELIIPPKINIKIVEFLP